LVKYLKKNTQWLSSQSSDCVVGVGAPMKWLLSSG